MSTEYSPGCTNEKAHTCDVCEWDDGRPTLYWKEKDFDICFSCLVSLYGQWAEPPKKEPKVIPRRIYISEELRNQIYEHDGGKCRTCGATEALSIDHIFPFSKGGKTELGNLQTLCCSCNLTKGTN